MGKRLCDLVDGVTLIGGLGLPTFSYYSARFGGYRYCENAVIRFFISRVTISKGHVNN